MKRNFRVHGFNHKTRVSQSPVDMNSSLGVELLWPLLKLIILTFKASSPKLFIIWTVFCTHRGSLSTGYLEYRLCQETMWPWIYQTLLTSKYPLKRHFAKWRFFFPINVNHYSIDFTCQNYTARYLPCEKSYQSFNVFIVQMCYG